MTSSPALPPAAPRWPVVTAAGEARAALSGAQPERVWALADDQVAEAVRVLAQLHASTEAQLVAVVAEAKSRGLGVGEGWGSRDWLRMHAPQLSTRTLADLDVVAGAVGQRRLGAVVEAVAAGADPRQVDAAEGALEIGKAAQIVRFHERHRAMADPQPLDDSVVTMVQEGRGRDGLSEKQLAVVIRHTADLIEPDRLVEHDADLRRAHRSLTKGSGPMGLWRYTMILDDEGAAIVDSAVDALAKPIVDPETGERDPRRPETRRADALLELVRCAAGSEDVPSRAKTSVVVTIGLDALQGRCRGAGLTLGDELLTTDTVRRLACDAQVVPAVMGARGEVLALGRAERLFNRAQVRHLWLRDRGCTFPGCTRLAKWCDAHHLVHWADDGPTDCDNGALLCQSHHTVVHRNRYAGEVLHGPRGEYVRWDLTPGSYDRQLEARAIHASARAARDSGATSNPADGGSGEPPPRP
jgi:hypothetical protein